MSRAISAAVAAVAVALLAPVTAFAAPSPEPMAPARGENGEFLVAEVERINSAVVERGAPLAASVSVSNPTAQSITEVVLTMQVTTDPLTSLDQLDAFLDDPAGVPLSPAAQEPAAPAPAPDAGEDPASEDEPEGDGQDEPEEPPVGLTLGPRGSTTMMVAATATELGLPAGQWGVYGVVLSLEVGGVAHPVDALPVTWAADGVPTLPVTVLATATGQPARVDALLSASNLPGVAVALDPTSLTSAQVFDQELLAREVLRIPAGDPDLTSLAHASDEELLDLALSTPAGTTLGALDAAPWLARPAALDQSVAQYVHEYAAAATLATPETLGHERLAEARAATVTAGEGAGTTLVADGLLSQTLESFSPGDEAVAATLVAQSALRAQEQDGAPVLVAPGTPWEPAGPAPSQALAALLDAPWVQVRTVGDLLADTPAQVSLAAEVDADNDVPASAVAELGARAQGLATLSTITANPDDALTDWGLPLVNAIPTSLRGQDGARDAALAAGMTTADATLDGIHIAESSELNLLAESGEIPITVINSLDRPVTVTVNVNSLSPSLLVQSRPTVTVPGGQEVLTPVTVEAVSSANVSLRASLLNDAGVAVSDVQTFSVRVRADWGTAATAVFSVLLVVLMVAGIARTIRRGRKDTRSRPGSAPATAPPSSDEIVSSEGEPEEGNRDGRA